MLVQADQDGEKRAEYRYILELGSTGIGDGLDIRGKGKTH